MSSMEINGRAFDAKDYDLLFTAYGEALLLHEKGDRDGAYERMVKATFALDGNGHGLQEDDLIVLTNRVQIDHEFINLGLEVTNGPA